MRLGLDVKDPLHLIRVVCLNLAAADTFTSVLDWFKMPLSDLSEWVATAKEVSDKREKATKRKR